MCQNNYYTLRIIGYKNKAKNNTVYNSLSLDDIQIFDLKREIGIQCNRIIQFISKKEHKQVVKIKRYAAQTGITCTLQ